MKDIISNPRELSQAVSFLHENGILLHYDTPALSHLYFVDPQWLCDMLAHVVTVPEVNRFIKRDAGELQEYLVCIVVLVVIFMYDWICGVFAHVQFFNFNGI